MALTERPWEDLHHQSSFLPDKERVANQLRNLKNHVDTTESTPNSQNPLSEGNLGNMSKTISIDISIKARVVEHIQIGTKCPLEENHRQAAMANELNKK